MNMWTIDLIKSLGLFVILLERSCQTKNILLDIFINKIFSTPLPPIYMYINQNLIFPRKFRV